MLTQGGVRSHDETTTNPSPAITTTPLHSTNGRPSHHAKLGQIQKGLGKAQGNRRRGGRTGHRQPKRRLTGPGNLYHRIRLRRHIHAPGARPQIEGNRRRRGAHGHGHRAAPVEGAHQRGAQYGKHRQRGEGSNTADVRLFRLPELHQRDERAERRAERAAGARHKG